MERLNIFLMKNSQGLFFLIGLILTLTLLWPLLVAPYFTHHDDVQIIRLYEMNKCIADVQIPCRWVPDLGGLYGYPLFNYYGPLPYYYGEIFYLFSHSLLFSAKVMFGTAFVFSYIFMFLCARKLWGSLGGSLSGIFYSYAPYHSVDFYVRGAMGELWALMLFPAIIWSLLRLVEKVSLFNSLILALFIAALIASHNLSAMIFLPFVVLLFVFFLVVKKEKILIPYFGLSILLGLLISAFYWLPALLEKQLVHVDSTISGYFHYTEHFKGLRKLFIDRDWGWGASVREVNGNKDGLSFQVGWVHLLGLILSLVSAKMLWRKKRTLSLVILLCTISFGVAVFMIHPRSEFVWKLLPPLEYLQFPWRFLMLIIFFIGLAVGSVMTIVDKKRKYLLWVGLVILVVLLNIGYFRPEKFVYTDDQMLLSGQKWDQQIKRSIFDYLPIYAKEPPAELATSRYEVITGSAEVSNFYENSKSIHFSITAQKLTFLRLSQYYFPNWVVKIDGKVVTINYKNELGLISFFIDPGKHTVDAHLENTIVRILANWLSVLGLLGAVFLLVVQMKKIRKYLVYVAKGFNK